MSVIAPAVGWLIPGAGHMIQKRWIRGALLFVSIVTLFLLGLGMQGRIYKANGGDILDILGFVGDVGAGGLYLLRWPWTGVRGHRLCDGGLWRNEVHDRRRTAELIAVADAYHIAIGKNSKPSIVVSPWSLARTTLQVEIH